MKTRSLALIIAALVVLGASPASAQEQDRPQAVGVGVAALLVGPAGPAVVFQTPAFHIEGILAFQDVGDETDIVLAGRFWYALSQTARSDFSVGGGIGLLNSDDGDESDTDIEFDLGAQIRAFIVDNVALSATLGFTVVAVEGDNPIAFTGDLVGVGGITYFF